MNRHTAVEHAASGFFQALGWMLGTAVIGVVFAALTLHPMGLVVGLLVAVLLFLRRSKRKHLKRSDIFLPNEACTDGYGELQGPSEQTTRQVKRPR